MPYCHCAATHEIWALQRAFSRELSSTISALALNIHLGWVLPVLVSHLVVNWKMMSVQDPFLT